MHRSALDYGRALQRRHTELLVLSLCHRSHGLCCNDRRGDRIKFKYQERCLRHRDRISDYVHTGLPYCILDSDTALLPGDEGAAPGRGVVGFPGSGDSHAPNDIQSSTLHPYS